MIEDLTWVIQEFMGKQTDLLLNFKDQVYDYDNARMRRKGGRRQCLMTY